MEFSGNSERRFCGGVDGAHSSCPGAPRVSLPLVARDRSKWPRCLLWYGWLPGLSAFCERAPWAESLGQLAVRSLEMLITLNFGFLLTFGMPMEIGDHPCMTQGSLEPTSGISVAGAGVYLPAPDLAMQDAILGRGGRRTW